MARSRTWRRGRTSCGGTSGTGPAGPALDSLPDPARCSTREDGGRGTGIAVFDADPSDNRHGPRPLGGLAGRLPSVDIIDRVRYRAVFFDAGETILHPHPSFPELLATVLREEGHQVDPDGIRDRLGVVSDRFTAAARDNELWSTSPERSRAFWAEIYRILLEAMDLPWSHDLAERLYATFTDLSNYRLFDDVVPTLEKLRAHGYELGLISNFEEWLEMLLEHLEVTPFFEVRVISGAAGVEKPDRRIFELALERAGARPAESVYVGDSLQFDVEPAASVGMLGVLIDRRDRYPDAEVPRIASLEELPALLTEERP